MATRDEELAAKRKADDLAKQKAEEVVAKQDDKPSPNASATNPALAANNAIAMAAEPVEAPKAPKGKEGQVVVTDLHGKGAQPVTG